jgi:hypothetical protein
VNLRRYCREASQRPLQAIPPEAPFCLLSARSYQTSFENHHPGLAASQTRRVEVGPDLLQAISGGRSKSQPICFGQGNCFARFDLRRKGGQGNDRRSQQAKYGQRRDGFDNLGLLTVARSRYRYARGIPFTTAGTMKSSASANYK